MAVGLLLGVVFIGGAMLIGHKTIELPRGYSLGPAEKPIDPESDAWAVLMFVCWVAIAGAAIGLAVLL